MSAASGNVVLVVYLVLTVVPGLALAAAFGLRGWLLVGSAVPLTYGLIGVTGPVLPGLGVLWSPLSFAAVTVGAVLLLLAIRFGYRRLPVGSRLAEVRPRSALPAWSALHQAGLVLAVLVAAGIGAAVALAATRGLTAVPQIWDAVFHANATRYIAATGRSDPGALQNLNNPVVSGYYYPNAYHVLAATAVMITGAAVPVVLDASVAIFPALLAISMATLTRQTGCRPALAVAATLLCCAFTAFPYDLLPWGTLLPFITSVALLPAFLALAGSALDQTGAGPVATPVALGISGVGLLALHPSGAIAAVLLVLALLGQRLLERGPRISDLRAVGITALAGLVIGAPLLVATTAAAAAPAYDWPASMRPADALGQLVFFAHEQLYPQYWLVLLAILGLMRPAPWRSLRWFVAPAALFAVLFVMAASYEGSLVAALTRPWWNDKWRFAALFTLGAIVVAGAGLVALKDWAYALLRRAVPRLDDVPPVRQVASAAILVVLALAVGSVSGWLYQDRNEARLAQGFTDGPAVSTAERTAFQELARLVPEGSTVMNDPYDGSALMWALNDVRPVFASPVIAVQDLPTMDPNRRILFEAFNQLDTNPAVRRALDELHVEYVILCSGLILPADGHAPGMRQLEQVSALHLVYQNSDARIYRIDRAARAGRG